MRVNEPITDREIVLPDGEPLVSRTDPAGRIEFANHVFVEVSGFAEQELVGSPHNIVRHPHMPEQAFANLWATIKAGRPWDGLVKNRAKSGDFYWVRANVTPVVQDDKITGFISIRSKPTQRHGQRHRTVGWRSGAERRARLAWRALALGARSPACGHDGRCARDTDGGLARICRHGVVERRLAPRL